ncbi:hypothetical protein [Pseudomonas sp. COW5]|uniref:hypothetical protein n=1 Tax=Pseudomonas sp. COW5 TaxID=2981253 RepID=UPI0022476BD6|nr:hypothetical protein [Pseudomonas sp. COW5]MCX2546124.1 hypothetical protein [Pseudomonas sp. COW5]
MEELMAASIGDRLNLIGFFFTFTGILASLLGAILMYVGSGITGDSVWNSIRKTQKVAEQASVVTPDKWTDLVAFDISNMVPPTATEVKLTYGMQVADTRIPLKMTVSSSSTVGVVVHGSGGQGQLSLIIEKPTVYVSVAHPDIKWNLVVSGYHFDR